LIIPALTLLSNLLKASARAASLESWLMKTSGVVVEGESPGAEDSFGRSAFFIVLPPV